MDNKCAFVSYLTTATYLLFMSSFVAGISHFLALSWQYLEIGELATVAPGKKEALGQNALSSVHLLSHFLSICCRLETALMGQYNSFLLGHITLLKCEDSRGSLEFV